MLLSVDIESAGIISGAVGLAVLLAQMLRDALSGKKAKDGYDMPGLEGSRLRSVERLSEDSTSRLDRHQKRLDRIEAFLTKETSYVRDF